MKMSVASILVAIIKVSCKNPNFLSLLLCSVFVAGKVFPVTISKYTISSCSKKVFLQVPFREKLHIQRTYIKRANPKDPPLKKNASLKRNGASCKNSFFASLSSFVLFYLQESRLFFAQYCIFINFFG
jgi:hypothetical protein